MSNSYPGLECPYFVCLPNHEDGCRFCQGHAAGYNKALAQPRKVTDAQRGAINDELDIALNYSRNARYGRALTDRIVTIIEEPDEPALSKE